MKIPTTLRYGVRMVVTLAQKGTVMTTGQLAEEMGVSPLYLRQLALPLQKMGFMKGLRGAKGGYSLTVEPAEITLFEIIRAYDEDFSLLDCIKLPHSCTRSYSCTSRYLWKELSELMKKTLQNMTLKDLMEKGRSDDQGRMEWQKYVT